MRASIGIHPEFGELDGQNMRLSYLGELDAECRRIFNVVGRDEMAGGAPRLEPFPRNRNFGFFDTMCRDDTDAFAFKPNWIVRFLGLMIKFPTKMQQGINCAVSEN